MIKILNSGLSDFMNPPDFNRFGCFPLTYYLELDGEILAVLYYKQHDEIIEILDLDSFSDDKAINAVDALCRAAMSAALNSGAKKCVFKNEKIKNMFSLSGIAEKSLEKVFSSKSCNQH